MLRTPTHLLPLLFLALSFTTTALAGVQELWWNISYVQNVNPDGLFPRRVIGVNGSWPPPPISINTTDSLLIHATNSVDQPATLHHHGMFFNSSSWMDGALGVSQCGIPTGQTFDYVVPINESGQWGTYWVHGHANGQYVDGLRAPLLLHPQSEVHAYDAEYTVILGDWYHQEHAPLFAKFASIADPGGAEPIPDAALIYYAQNTTYLPPLPSTTPPNTPTSSIGFNENSTLPFSPGKTYRLRVINTGAFATFYFWIDGHQMRIIEGDGTDTEEYPTDLLTLGIAQRYSVLVTARNDTSANWAVHANMDTTMFDFVPANLQYNVTSSITYSPSSPLTAPSTIEAYHDINDTSLTPSQPLPQYPPATKNLSLVVSFDTMSNGINRGMFNLVTYDSPLVPAILTELSMGSEAGDAVVYGPQSFVFDHLDIVDLTVFNSDTGKHPFHIHGHKPQLVHRSANYSSDDPTENPPLVEGQENPMRRDTVLIPSMSSATYRFVVDNPGVWFFHCHIEWHLEVGLAVQLIMAPPIAQERASNGQVPQAIYEQCQALGLPTSGNAAGHNSTTDFSGLTEGPYPQVLGWKPKGIVAMTGCVFTAFLGILTVAWYSLGQNMSEEEMEAEARVRQEQKLKRRRFFGLMPPKAS